MGEHPDVVLVEQCFGCNRLRMPKPYTPTDMPALNAAGRLRVREYLCDHDDCMALDLIGGARG